MLTNYGLLVGVRSNESRTVKKKSTKKNAFFHKSTAVLKSTVKLHREKKEWPQKYIFKMKFNISWRKK